MHVVSLVPSLTEALFYLGLDERSIVGITRWCVHPADRVAAVERVGGTKDPHVERIVALAPDVVIANREENRLEDVDRLQRAGVRVVVTDIRRARDAGPAMVTLGDAVGTPAAARSLACRIESAVERLTNAARARPIVRVYCPVWRRPWMSLNGDTFAHDVLRLAGATNVFSDAPERYPLAAPEQARARGAVAAILPSEPYSFALKHVDEFVAAGFSRERIGLVDGEALTWYGPRMLNGLTQVLAAVDAIRGGTNP